MMFTELTAEFSDSKKYKIFIFLYKEINSYLALLIALFEVL